VGREEFSCNASPSESTQPPLIKAIKAKMNSPATLLNRSPRPRGTPENRRRTRERPAAASLREAATEKTSRRQSDHVASAQSNVGETACSTAVILRPPACRFACAPQSAAGGTVGIRRCESTGCKVGRSQAAQGRALNHEAIWPISSRNRGLEAGCMRRSALTFSQQSNATR
jgi:hypothetical protein